MCEKLASTSTTSTTSMCNGLEIDSNQLSYLCLPFPTSNTPRSFQGSVSTFSTYSKDLLYLLLRTFSTYSKDLLYLL